MVHWMSRKVASTAGFSEQGVEWYKMRMRGRQGRIIRGQVGQTRDTACYPKYGLHALKGSKHAVTRF